MLHCVTCVIICCHVGSGCVVLCNLHYDRQSERGQGVLCYITCIMIGCQWGGVKVCYITCIIIGCQWEGQSVLCNLDYNWLPVESLSVCCVTGQWLVGRRRMWRCWCWSHRQPPRSSWTSPPAPPSWGECSSTSWGPSSAASSYAGASPSSVSFCVCVCVYVCGSHSKHHLP